MVEGDSPGGKGLSAVLACGLARLHPFHGADRGVGVEVSLGDGLGLLGDEVASADSISGVNQGDSLTSGLLVRICQ